VEYGSCLEKEIRVLVGYYRKDLAHAHST
jgi:hypothetical protein